MTINIEILQFLHYHPLANRAEIMAGLTKAPSDSTMKRLLSAAVKDGWTWSCHEVQTYSTGSCNNGFGFSNLF